MSDAVTRLNAALEGRNTIERERGEGGMATVYLADDLKHERKVALKVLKPELAAVVGAERFLTEIKTTANLQHPHILPLFDSGEADGFLFYVMPYVEGETLRERIDSEKQLPVDEAVRIATAVAHALDHAHRQDVIHRDIKPANILLQDGEPVVADFGIALALGAAGGNRLTETGLSLGTPYYMSPEQATSDQEVGPASDTYALACVLYEMLVGEPPFSATTARAVLVKILTTDAPSVTTARKTVPPHVDRVLTRALQKLPADRFATAAQFAEALTNPAFTAPTTPPPDAVPETAGSRQRYSLATWQLAVGFGVAVALGATVGILSDGAELEPAGPVTRFTMDVVLGGTTRGSPVVLSGDGSGLVYIGVGEEGESRLYRRSLAGVDELPIAGTEGNSIQMPFFSPDGEMIGFQENRELRTVVVDGGTPRLIARVSPVLNGLTWAPGGLIVYNGDRGTGLMVVSAEGGEPRTLTTVDSDAGEYAHYWPHALPDGRSVVFTIWKGSLPLSRLGVVSLETGEVRDLGPGTDARYIDAGYLVYASPEGALRAVAFDMAAGEMRGSPFTLLPSVALDTSGGASFSISRNGVLTFVSSLTSRVPVLVDSLGSVTTLPGLDPGTYQSARFSPDGNAFAVGYEGEVWVYDFTLGTFAPVTLAGGFYPLWTADGTRILFSRYEGPDASIFSIRADGGEEEVAVLQIPGQQNRTQDLSPDGEHLILRRNSGAESYDLFTLALDSTDTAEPWLATPFLERAPTFSPDGNWIAYSSDESGRDEVSVRPFRGTGRTPVTTRGGTEPAWAPDGTRLYYRSGDRLEWVEIQTDPTFQVLSPPQTLFRGRFYSWNWSQQYDVHPDGDGFLMFQDESDESELTVVVGFIEELMARVEN